MAYVCSALCLTAMSLECCRVLQAVGYRPGRGYFRVLTSGYYVIVCIAEVAAVFMWVADAPAFAVALVYLVATAICVCIPRRCPLVFTARVWRLLAVVLALNLVVCFTEVHIAAIAVPFVVLAAWGITLPVERLIMSKYLRKASEKLHGSGVPVIAVTGSFGKTSVKNMLAEMLDGAVCPPGSCNTPGGIAKFVNGGGLNGAKYVVLEFGARQRGDIAELCRLYPPTFGIVTGVCPQHLATFGNLQNIVDEKSVLPRSLPECGLCVVGGGDERFAVGECPKVFVGDNVRTEVTSFSMDGQMLAVSFANDEQMYEVHLPQIADYAPNTFAMCAEMCLALGMSPQQIVQNAARITQTPHRMQVTNCGFYVVDDGYNASLSGVESSCKTLSKFGGKKCAVAQGIVEGGRQSRQLNARCGKMLGETFDEVVIVGPNRHALEEGLLATNTLVLHANSLAEATEIVRKNLSHGDILYYQNDIPDLPVT